MARVDVPLGEVRTALVPIQVTESQGLTLIHPEPPHFVMVWKSLVRKCFLVAIFVSF